MEKNEDFRNKVLSSLYGLPDPTESEKREPDEGKPQDEKVDNTSNEKEEQTSVPVAKKDDDCQAESEENILHKTSDTDKETVKENEKEEDKVKIDSDHCNNNGDTSTPPTTASDSHSSTSKSTPTHTTPTTTTSHLYSVLMAPLDGNSPYRDHALRFGLDTMDGSPRKRMRLENSGTEKVKAEFTVESRDHSDSKSTADINNSVGMDLTKNQKRKLKKKKRKHLLNKLEVQRAKDFIYSSENEQFSVEKLRTMIEDITEFLDAIWDVYCSDARIKGESVEEDGGKVTAVLKCLSESGEGSWGDLQLLSRAKSVLVLRSKNLAASTIARVENELGYDTDTRNFIVRMLKFWMGEIVTKG